MLIRFRHTALPLVGQFKIGITGETQDSTLWQKLIRHIENALLTPVGDYLGKGGEILGFPRISTVGKISAQKILPFRVGFKPHGAGVMAIYDQYHADKRTDWQVHTPMAAKFVL